MHGRCLVSHVRSQYRIKYECSIKSNIIKEHFIFPLTFLGYTARDGTMVDHGIIMESSNETLNIVEKTCINCRFLFVGYIVYLKGK